MTLKTLKLRKPIFINGSQIEELTYDIDELTINHVTSAEALKSKISGLSANSLTKLAQADFCLHICLGIYAILAVNPSYSEEDLLRIKGYDLTVISTIGSTFFISPDELVDTNLDKQQEVTQDITNAQSEKSTTVK